LWSFPLPMMRMESLCASRLSFMHGVMIDGLYLLVVSCL
jgi:hypothetical protein